MQPTLAFAVQLCLLACLSLFATVQTHPISSALTARSASPGVGASRPGSGPSPPAPPTDPPFSAQAQGYQRTAMHSWTRDPSYLWAFETALDPTKHHVVTAESNGRIAQIEAYSLDGRTKLGSVLTGGRAYAALEVVSWDLTQVRIAVRFFGTMNSGAIALWEGHQQPRLPSYGQQQQQWTGLPFVPRPLLPEERTAPWPPGVIHRGPSGLWSCSSVATTNCDPDWSDWGSDAGDEPDGGLPRLTDMPFMEAERWRQNQKG